MSHLEDLEPGGKETGHKATFGGIGSIAGEEGGETAEPELQDNGGGVCVLPPGTLILTIRSHDSQGHTVHVQRIARA
jgi:hypothetical protein